MTSLALTSWQITALLTGEVQIGGATMPASVAADLALRIYEAAQSVPAEVQGRVRCRTHLDAMFATAGRIRCWPTLDSKLAVVRPALFDGRRCVVRLTDTSTAVLLERGGYFRGYACNWREDALFGCVAEIAVPMCRMSAKAVGVKALGVRP